MTKTNSGRAALLLIVSLFGTLAVSPLQAAPLASSNDYAALALYSRNAIVVDQTSGSILYDKNSDVRQPIASITKLMTAIVTMDANLPMEQLIQITADDVDMLRKSRSRLKVGPSHSRRELLHLALMSSENRAASALARSYPGGRAAFIKAMNAKARELGMKSTRFADSTGLNSENVSTARDLVKMVQAGYGYPLIRALTTSTSYDLNQGKVLKYKNSNPLFNDKNWQIGLSKTGYIIPAGHCLVMQTQVANKPLIIVLLDADARSTVSADSNRIKSWLGTMWQKGKLVLTKSDAISGIISNAVAGDSRSEASNSLQSKRIRATYQPPTLLHPDFIGADSEPPKLKM